MQCAQVEKNLERIWNVVTDYIDPGKGLDPAEETRKSPGTYPERSYRLH